MLSSLVLLLTILSPSVFAGYHPPTRSCCPSYWTSFRGNCYRIYGERSVTWQQAENHCVYEGHSLGKDAHLVSLHSQAESDFVKNFWNSASGRRVTEPVWRNMYWIGLTDAHYEGHFKWSDGSPKDYTNFHAGEPNNHGSGQDCIVVWDYKKLNQGLWDDQQCYNKHPFICKFPQ